MKHKALPIAAALIAVALMATNTAPASASGLLAQTRNISNSIDNNVGKMADGVEQVGFRKHRGFGKRHFGHRRYYRGRHYGHRGFFGGRHYSGRHHRKFGRSFRGGRHFSGHRGFGRHGFRGGRGTGGGRGGHGGHK